MQNTQSIQDLLRSGQQTNDAAFAGSFFEHMSRTVYLMTRHLSTSQDAFVSSVVLQQRIDQQLLSAGVKPVQERFNPVDWFSQQWTLALNGEKSQYFKSEYLELFERKGEAPTTYRINPAFYEDVRRALAQLETESELAAVQGALEREGAFDPLDTIDARTRMLRAVVVRQGQPMFRNALLQAYGGRCAATGYDAAPALEAAHISPYHGSAANTINNGLLLRADVHTLFDLELVAIEPDARLVRVASQLKGTAYWDLDGRPLREPHDAAARPSGLALDARWSRFLLLR